MKAGEAGGIEAVIQTMNAHVDNADVCKAGCGALMNMTANNGKRALISLIQ